MKKNFLMKHYLSLCLLVLIYKDHKQDKANKLFQSTSMCLKDLGYQKKKTQEQKLLMLLE